MFTGSMGRISVFCSYAREDDALRARVEQALAPLRAEHVVDDWTDHRILPGQQWNAQIAAALDRTRLMLFIVTPDLMASDYVERVEIPKAIERERQGRCQVVPIMARRTDWDASPLARFQALPGQGRWIDDSDDDAAAYARVEAGVRDACRRIVDWDNPYRRSSVGDWVHVEQTVIGPDGRRVTLGGTEEVVAKTDTTLTVAVELQLPDRIGRHTLTVDLTQPYEQNIGDTVRQAGQAVPPDFEFSLGPAVHADEAVNLGGRHHETVRSERRVTLGQPGQMMTGSIVTWRSIDVPLYGRVKGTSTLPGFQQHQVLLDFGHGDAATRKPRLRPLGGGPPDAPPGFGPGRWTVQMSAYGMVSAFDMVFHPDGLLQGRQMGVPLPVQQAGRWGFDIDRGLLTMAIGVSRLGLPLGQETVFVQFDGGQPGALFAQDALGRRFQFVRTG